MRPRTRLSTTVGAAVLALAGCDGADPESQPAAESPESAAAGELPEIGTCWAVPEESVADQQYWFDDSPQVPCSEPHTTETVWVVSLDAPTIAEAKVRSAGCGNIASRYVGIDATSWIPWGVVTFLPSKEEVADGASWARCDAAFPQMWPFGRARTITGSASALAHDPPGEFWACLDQPPIIAGQPFAPCDQPHKYEETGQLAFIPDLDSYPPSAEREAEGRRQCREEVPPGYDGVAVTAAWDPAATLEASKTLAGVCFMFNADGTPLPAR